MNSLNYQMDLILYHIFDVILNIPEQSMEHSLINCQLKYISTKIKTELHSELKLSTYYLESLIPETEILWKYRKPILPIGSIKRKITKYYNGKNMLELKITEVVLVHCNIVGNQN